MSVYSYAPGSILDKVNVVKTDGGGVRAYLHAPSNVSTEQLAKITSKLSRLAWQCIPTSRDGQPVLEVRGFKKEEVLIDALRSGNFVSGTPSISEGNEDRLTMKERFQKSTLQASGAFYILGDIGFSAYGYRQFAKDFFKNKKPLTESAWQDMVAGLAYFAGSMTLAGFGKADKSEHQLRDISHKVRRFVLNEGINLPEDCSLDSITHDYRKGVIAKTADIFERYPSEIMNAFFGAAGMLITIHAFKHEKDLARKVMDVGLGMMTFTSGAISALVEEKAHDPNEPKSHGLMAVWDWVREKPLRVAGWGYIASTLCHAGSTVHKYRSLKSKPHMSAEDLTELKELRTTVGFRALFVAANLIAEFLMTLSSKGHGDGVKTDSSLEKSTYAMAAELISKQNPAIQPMLVEHISGFMAHPDVLGGNAKKIAEGISAQLQSMRSNPWAAIKPQAQDASWQSKVMVPAAPTPSLGPA